MRLIRQKWFVIPAGVLVTLLLMLMVPIMSTAQKPGTPPDDWAEYDVTIEFLSQGLIKVPIAIPDLVNLGRGARDAGQLGIEGAKILSHDLKFSSYFRIISPSEFIEPSSEREFTADKINFDNWSKTNAEYLVVGFYTLKRNGSLELTLRLMDVVTKSMKVEMVQAGTRKNLRMLIHRFADKVLEAETGELGPFNSRIAFVSNRTGKRELYICDYDGNNMVRVTNNRSINLSPSWSPDGKSLVYTSYVKGNPNLHLLNLSLGKARYLWGSEGLNLGAEWSPQGDRLAFSSSENPEVDLEIYSMNSAGKDLRRLTRSWGIDISPTWSHDGKHIAFVSSRLRNKPQIFVMESWGSKPLRVSRSGGYNTSPSWSPTNGVIAYTARVSGGGFDILTITLDEDLRVIQTMNATHMSGADEDPSFSPDGRFLVFSHGSRGSYDLYITSLREGKPKRITRMPGKETTPGWSRRLAPVK